VAGFYKVAVSELAAQVMASIPPSGVSGPMTVRQLADSIALTETPS
jgi:hypothetical protein